MASLSIVTPVYNESTCLKEFYGRLSGVLAAIGDSYEIIFVDDGSVDETPEILAQLSRSDSRVKVVTLSRNFGHHPAVFAGWSFASGDLIVTVDADLQDPPELIPQLLKEHARGFELIFARRKGNQDGFFLGALKRSFRWLMRHFSQLDFPDNVGVYSLMERRLKDLLLEMPERERYLVAMQMFLGFRVGYVDYVRQIRTAGRSKQGLRRLFRLGMNSLFSYSSLPLQFAMVAGLCCLAASLAGIGIVLYHKFILRVTITGWTSVMLTLLIMGTVQLLSLWMIGEYVDRIFENTKLRPYYIIWKQSGQRGIANQPQALKEVK